MGRIENGSGAAMQGQVPSAEQATAMAMEAGRLITLEQREKLKTIIRRFRPFDDTFLRRMLRDDQPLVEHILRIVTGDGSMTLAYSETQRDVNRIPVCEWGIPG